jgi:DNA-binding Lrp family transcriptional regulator
MDRIDQALLHMLQDGIPLVEEPFREVARKIGISQDEVISRLKALIRSRVIRRFGVSINHRRIGVVANVLVAWKVPQNRIKKIGRMLSRYEEITHCYERRTIPGKWEYNLFTVIHGCDRESVKKLVKKISESAGLNEYVIMFSIKQFKRSSIKPPKPRYNLRSETF